MDPITSSTVTSASGRTIEKPVDATIIVGGKTYTLDAIETYQRTGERWVSYRTAKRSIRRPLRSTDTLAGVTA